MQKQILIIFIIILILGLCVSKSSYALKFDNTKFVKAGKKIILTDVAKTPEQKQLGLMYAPKIAENQGMIFFFKPDEKKYFWTKNLKFPLDIIFIYKNKIIKIFENVPICTEDPCILYGIDVPADSVLEVNGGFCSRNAIKEGQKILFSPALKKEQAMFSYLN